MEPVAKLTYQYQLLRYRHDYFAGEFVNLGLVYFDPETGFAKASFEDGKYGRLTQFFGEAVQGGAILKVLKQLGNKVAGLTNPGHSSESGVRFGNIAELTSALLPPDDNGLHFSEVFQGWHFDHEISFRELYDRIIGKYQEISVKRQDDAFAWKNIYKKHFDRLNITSLLHPHKVVTNSDTFDFQHAAQNGAWHCLQSITFDLKHETTIKEKVYRWNGIIQELSTSREPVHLYLLSIMPTQNKINELIRKKLNVGEGNVEVTLVTEEEAEKTALAIKRQLLDAEHH